jgi:coiled-coil domain-containing protein 39
MAEDRYKKNQKELKDLLKKIEQEKDALLKSTEVLFKLRENEANLYGDIQGQMAACRNLQSHIN